MEDQLSASHGVSMVADSGASFPFAPVGNGNGAEPPSDACSVSFMESQLQLTGHLNSFQSESRLKAISRPLEGIQVDGTNALATDGGAEADVELEADAESLASSGSDEVSDADVAEVEYFRFSRAGLSVTLDLNIDDKFKAEKPFANASIATEETKACTYRPSPRRMINFEEECIKSYPACHFIGTMVSRYSDVVPLQAIDQIPEATKSRISNELSVPDSSGAVSITSNTAFLSQNEVQRLVPSHTEDRLSAVITDILHRLNRQGVLADPRAVCKKGGGKSGDFYDKDDTFFDDDEVLDQLGVTDASTQSSCAHDDFSDGEESASEGVEGYYEYNYNDPTLFVCDDVPENDEEPLIMDVVQYASVQDKSASSVYSESDGKDKRFVTTEYWIKPKAWRKLEDKLPPELSLVLSGLETELDVMGNRHGLFVEPEVVLSQLQAVVQKVFEHVHPSIPWCLRVDEVMKLLAAETANTVTSPVENLSLETESITAANHFKLSSPPPCLRPSDNGHHSLDLPLSVSESDRQQNDQSSFEQQAMVEDCSILDTKSKYSNKPDLDVHREGRPHDNAQECKKFEAEEVLNLFDKRKKKQKAPKTIIDQLNHRNLAPLHWPHLELLNSCFSSMTSVFSSKYLQRWWTGRLVVYNQLIYNIIEDRLIEYITKKSILFKKANSNFFKALKRSVDAYILSLASVTKLSQQASAESQNNQQFLANKSEEEKSPQQLLAAIDSPYFSVAPELLNWAIVYNSRKHELKETGEIMDEWSASFASYSAEKLNSCIVRRRQDEEVKVDNNKKNRIWTPVKYMEETLKQFKLHYNLPNLCERKSKKVMSVPTFLFPCRGLGVHPPRNKMVRTPVAPEFKPMSDQPDQLTPQRVAAAAADLESSTHQLNSNNKRDSSESTPSDQLNEQNGPTRKRKKRDKDIAAPAAREGPKTSKVRKKRKTIDSDLVKTLFNTNDNKECAQVNFLRSSNEQQQQQLKTSSSEDKQAVQQQQQSPIIISEPITTISAAKSDIITLVNAQKKSKKPNKNRLIKNRQYSSVTSPLPLLRPPPPDQNAKEDLDDDIQIIHCNTDVESPLPYHVEVGQQPAVDNVSIPLSSSHNSSPFSRIPSISSNSPQSVVNMSSNRQPLEPKAETYIASSPLRKGSQQRYLSSPTVSTGSGGSNGVRVVLSADLNSDLPRSPHFSTPSGPFISPSYYPLSGSLVAADRPQLSETSFFNQQQQHLPSCYRPVLYQQVLIAAAESQRLQLTTPPQQQSTSFQSDHRHTHPQSAAHQSLWTSLPTIETTTTTTIGCHGYSSQKISLNK